MLNSFMGRGREYRPFALLALLIAAWFSPAAAQMPPQFRSDPDACWELSGWASVGQGNGNACIASTISGGGGNSGRFYKGPFHAVNAVKACVNDGAWTGPNITTSPVYGGRGYYYTWEHRNSDYPGYGGGVQAVYGCNGNPVVCGNGDTKPSGENCTVRNPAVCQAKQGQTFTTPQNEAGGFRFDETGAESNVGSLTGRRGSDYGCEWRIFRCDESGTCHGCYTGDGGYSADDEQARRTAATGYPGNDWLASPGGRTAAGACPTKPSYSPGVDYCSTVFSPTYDSKTNTCQGVPITKNCNDPTLAEHEGCTYVIGGQYVPPVQPTPPTPQEMETNEPPVTNPSTPIPGNLPPGHTPQPGDSSGPPGGLGNAPGGIGANGPGTGTDGGYSGGAGESTDDGDSTVSWGDFPGIPAEGFYERRYGPLSSVVAEKMQDVADTAIGQSIGAFNIPAGTGTPPTFTLDLTPMDLGLHEIGFPEYLWPIARAFMIIIACLVARRLIFGG